jgi:hypothetical protein
MTNEVWLPIKGYEGSYEVSNLGGVRSVDRIIERSKRGKLVAKGKMLLLRLNKGGYQTAGLWLSGKGKPCQVHRLVAIAFIPNPENKPQVNHIDGAKTNNIVSNLEWATSLENMTHARVAGLIVYKLGTENPNARLTPSIVREIRALGELGHKYKHIGNALGVSPKQVSNIINMKQWKHLV